jgi:RNA polymerase sigma factor (sigma-70 family)
LNIESVLKSLLEDDFQQEKLNFLKNYSLKIIYSMNGKNLSIEDKNDIIQDTLLEFYKRGKKPKVIDSLSAYYNTILKNKVKHFLNKFHNKNYYSFKKKCNIVLENLKNNGKIYSNNNRIADSLEKLNMPVAIEESLLNKIILKNNHLFLRKEQRWTAEKLESLEKLILSCLNDSDSFVEKETFVYILTRSLGFGLTFIINIDNDDNENSNENFEIKSEELDFQIKVEIDDLVKEFVKNNFSYHDKKELILSLCYYRCFKKLKLKEIAEKLNYSSVGSINYLLNKYGIEDKIKKLCEIVLLSIDIKQTDFENIIGYCENEFLSKIEKEFLMLGS